MLKPLQWLLVQRALINTKLSENWRRFWITIYPDFGVILLQYLCVILHILPLFDTFLWYLHIIWYLHVWHLLVLTSCDNAFMCYLQVLTSCMIPSCVMPSCDSFMCYLHAVLSCVRFMWYFHVKQKAVAVHLFTTVWGRDANILWMLVFSFSLPCLSHHHHHHHRHLIIICLPLFLFSFVLPTIDHCLSVKNFLSACE